MPNSGLPSALAHITNTATMLDGTPIDYSKFTLTTPTVAIPSLFGKSQKVAIRPTAVSGYYGDIVVYYNKIDLSTYAALNWVEDAVGYTGDKVGILATVSAYLGVEVTSDDIVNDAIVTLTDPTHNSYFVIQAAAGSILWTGGLKLITLIPPAYVLGHYTSGLYPIIVDESMCIGPAAIVNTFLFEPVNDVLSLQTPALLDGTLLEHITTPALTLNTDNLGLTDPTIGESSLITTISYVTHTASEDTLGLNSPSMGDGTLAETIIYVTHTASEDTLGLNSPSMGDGTLI